MSGQSSSHPSAGPASRGALWQKLKQLTHQSEPESPAYDLIVIGGGITGAGVAREALRHGLRVLLLEQRDFTWGTSSRSSKMVHGGLRYIAQGDIKLTRHALQERERLLKEVPGLVYREGYVFPHRKGAFPPAWAFRLLLALYDFLAGIRDHRFWPKKNVLEAFPGLSDEKLIGASYYTDAITDDCRLVLRLLSECARAGADVLNYARVTGLQKDETGRVTGVKVLDTAESEPAPAQEEVAVTARVVVNATGAWADRLREQLVDETHIRPLRGSHIFLPAERLPVKAGVLTVLHPRDKRPVFIYPWEGVSVVGTTDLDHRHDMDEEPAMNQLELEYLLECVNSQFPHLEITPEDVISSMAGVRPVVASGKGVDPSKERRDHVVWAEQGMVTVSGGKLTTFRLIAQDVLAAANAWLKEPLAHHQVYNDAPVFSSQDDSDELTPAQQRLQAFYGADWKAVMTQAAGPDELECLAGTPYCLAELRYSLAREWVEHLDDALLRRTRLGLLLPEGARELEAPVRQLCQQELGWTDERWHWEWQRYQAIIRSCYSLPRE